MLPPRRRRAHAYSVGMRSAVLARAVYLDFCSKQHRSPDAVSRTQANVGVYPMELRPRALPVNFQLRLSADIVCQANESLDIRIFVWKLESSSLSR